VSSDSSTRQIQLPGPPSPLAWASRLHCLVRGIVGQ
jgi:hypothetical protein